MQKMKILSLLIILSFVIPVMAVPVMADDTFEDEYLYYFDGFDSGEKRGGTTYILGEPYLQTLATGEEVLTFKAAATKTAARVGIMNYDEATGKTSTFKNPNATSDNPTAELPPIVLEYRMKAYHVASGSYMSYRKTGYEANMIFFANNSYTSSKNILWYAAFPENDPNVMAAEEFGDYKQWHTYALVYNPDENTRSLYVDGEYMATSKDTTDANANPWYNKGQITWTFQEYINSNILTEGADMDYVKVYSPPTEFSVKAYSDSYNLDEFILDFNSTVADITEDFIEVPGYTVENLELIDMENQLWRVKLNETLIPGTAYDIYVSGVTDVLGNMIIGKTVNYTTREKEFYISDMKVTDGINEIENAQSGELYFNVSVNNELNEQKTGSFMLAQYDSEGYLIKDKLESVNFDLTNDSCNVNYDFEAVSPSEISVMGWENENTPIPISGYITYSDQPISGELTYNIPEYTGNATVEAVIKDDYSGAIITVDTKETDQERLVGLLVKYNNEIEYIKSGKTINGKLSFDVPLHEEQIGSYSIIAGIEKGGLITLTPSLKYYSPNFINEQLDLKVNSAEATSQTVSEFVDLLGSYLGLDISELEKLENKNIAYERLLSIRNTKENQKYSTQEELTESFSTAIKMASIYEGKNTVALISESSDLSVDAYTKEVFKNQISSSARSYVADKLRGITYNIPSDMTDDVKKYTIFGGVYKADHYKQVYGIIKAYGTELGIDMVRYDMLKSPEKVDNAVMGFEYPDFTSFANDVNRAISEVYIQENTIVTPPVGGGGGGGGSAGSKIYPAEKEEKKEENKPKPAKSYNDVKETDWFRSDVMWATEEGWFVGTGNDCFSPQMNLKWEHIVIVLGRMGFKAENKSGNADIKRGEFANLLYKFLAEKEKYADVNSWISGTGIFIGDDNGNLMFDKPLTRAECCTILRRIEDK